MSEDIVARLRNYRVKNSYMEMCSPDVCQDAAKEIERLRAIAPTDGWLYTNPDTGTEWSEQHPVESGEVPDATNVRAGTAMALQHELITAWDYLRRAEAEIERLRTRLDEAATQGRK